MFVELAAGEGDYAGGKIALRGRQIDQRDCEGFARTDEGWLNHQSSTAHHTCRAATYAAALSVCALREKR